MISELHVHCASGGVFRTSSSGVPGRERPGHRAPKARFLRELEDHLDEEEADEVLETIINWGRHAELFAYDYDSEVLSLENPE